MSKPILINSPAHFSEIINGSTIVVTDFYADWCGPCKQIAPFYEKLAGELSRPGKMTFVKVDTDAQKNIAQSYNITAMPTFLVFKNGREVNRIRGADPGKISEAVQKLAAEADGAGSSGGGFGESSGAGSADWTGHSIPKGFSDVTSAIDTQGLELLNADGEFGGVRTLFESTTPSGLAATGKGKGKGAGDASSGQKKDWVESDTDPQLMLYVPFQSNVKLHSILVTSLPPYADDEDEAPMRPKTVKMFINSAHNLGFEEAEDMTATQEVTLSQKDWNQETGTAKIELRYVKFQKVTSVVLFVVDGDGDGEKTRIDRLRFIGETGEKRAMGKLEKIGDEQGE